MEVPRYRLDFEIDAYYDIKEDIEINMFDYSKIVLYKSKTTNKGAIFFETKSLDQAVAKEEGKSKINHFLNCLLVSANADNMMPLRFPKAAELLNPQKFEGMTKTVSKDFTVRVSIVAPLQKTPVDTANALMERISRLDGNTQAAICKCLSWLRRAAENSRDERFIYRWISIEALFGVLQEKHSSTQKMINVLLNTHLDNETAKSIFKANENAINELAKANLVGWNGAKRSEDLNSVLQQQTDFKTITMRATLCILEVRNRLFHRGEETSLISPCNSLLRHLINKTLMSIAG
jgi:hypothetical protein